jgi:hypothetical protein
VSQQQVQQQVLVHSYVQVEQVEQQVLGLNQQPVGC